MKPLRIRFGENTYEIERIIRVRNHCPQVVACIAPLEYTVQIDGICKDIYYESETGTWFSVRAYD